MWFRHVWRGEVNAPDGYVHAVGGDEVDVAVEAGAGVPAGGPGQVLQAHLEGVEARAGHAVQVGGEGVVAVGPVGDVAPVDVDVCVGHGAVEEEGEGLSGGDIDNQT